jgi:YesN/AraC family two-component response regulator
MEDVVPESRPWLFKALAALLLVLFGGIWRLLSKRQARKNEILPEKKEDPEFKRVLEYIEMHLSEALTTEKVRNDLRFSSHQFYKILKNHGQASLPQLLNTARVTRAKALLKNSLKTISEISFEVGFSEARYFNKVFKDSTNLTPGEFRKQSLPADPIRS